MKNFYPDFEVDLERDDCSSAPTRSSPSRSSIDYSSTDSTCSSRSGLIDNSDDSSGLSNRRFCTAPIKLFYLLLGLLLGSSRANKSGTLSLECWEVSSWLCQPARSLQRWLLCLEGRVASHIQAYSKYKQRWISVQERCSAISIGVVSKKLYGR